MNGNVPEYTISLKVAAPDEGVAKQVANEAQALVDYYGVDLFLKTVRFMKENPTMVNLAISLVCGRQN